MPSQDDLRSTPYWNENTDSWAPGSGSQTVTDGDVSLTASTLRFPAGTITDLGSGVAGVTLIPQMIGPYHVTYQTAGIGSSEDGALLTELPGGGTALLQVMVFPLNSGGFDADFVVALGGPDYAAPDDDFRTVFKVDANQGPSQTAGVYAVAAPHSAVFGIIPGGIIWSVDGGALVAQLVGAATQGQADVYAVIATPAAAA